MRTVETQSPATDSPYKYSIITRLYAFDKKRRAEIRENIMKSENIGSASYSRYINLRKTDKQDMPASVLYAFASQLGVSIEDLFN